MASPKEPRSARDVNLSRTDIENLIDEWIVGMHAERNRAIMKRRLIDGICYEPLAEEFDMSVRPRISCTNVRIKYLNMLSPEKSGLNFF